MAEQVQIKVTPSSAELEFIEKVVKASGRARAEVIMDGFRRSLITLVIEYQLLEHARGNAEEVLQESEEDENVEPVATDLAKDFIKALALGHPISTLVIQELAIQLGLPSERLANAIKLNGDKKNAKNKV